MSIQYKLGALAVLAMLMTGNAFAKTYGVWLKGENGAFVQGNLKCAAGTVNSDTGAFNMTIEKDCFTTGVPGVKTIISETTGAKVQTALIQSKDEQPVSSADGVTFLGAGLTLAWASKAPAIGTRTFTFVNDQNVIQAEGTYHLFTQDPKDPVNQIPEPETLILALAGLAGLAWTRRKRR